MEIVQTQKRSALLVAERPFYGDFIMFITISPNPRTLINVVHKSKTLRLKDKVLKKPYEECKQIDQYNYCMSIVRDIYLRYCKSSKLIGCAELNQRGNVHIHLLYQDEVITNVKLMEVFRRDVMTDPEVKRHIKGSRDYMNNIVKLTKSLKEITDYMDKDHGQTTHLFPNFYSREIVTDEVAKSSGVKIRLA